MSTRAHLVGSIPAEDPEDAMDLALSRLGPHLRTLPDGETGERRNWIIHIIELFRDHPDLELRRDGDWTGYDDIPVFRIRRGHQLAASSLDFGHVAAFQRSFPAFLERREAAGRPDLAFQVGLPGDFDMALFTLGPSGPFLHRAPFTEATLAEIRAIHAQGGDDVVFQLELPAELVAVARMPSVLQPAMARYLAGGVTDLVAAAPEGTRVGIHLCLGDMNHRALGRMSDVSPLVHLANAIAARWPSGRPLEYVHAPFAAAVEPPPNRTSFYRPVERIRLGRDVPFVAGFVHEDLSLEAHRTLRDHLSGLLGRPVDVATACGLGRRERTDAERTMELAAALCD